MSGDRIRVRRDAKRIRKRSEHVPIHQCRLSAVLLLWLGVSQPPSRSGSTYISTGMVPPILPRRPRPIKLVSVPLLRQKRKGGAWASEPYRVKYVMRTPDRSQTLRSRQSPEGRYQTAKRATGASSPPPDPTNRPLRNQTYISVGIVPPKLPKRRSVVKLARASLRHNIRHGTDKSDATASSGNALQARGEPTTKQAQAATSNSSTHSRSVVTKPDLRFHRNCTANRSLEYKGFQVGKFPAATAKSNELVRRSNDHPRLTRPSLYSQFRRYRP
jgi:hypothetical protein